MPRTAPVEAMKGAAHPPILTKQDDSQPEGVPVEQERGYVRGVTFVEEAVRHAMHDGSEKLKAAMHKGADQGHEDMHAFKLAAPMTFQGMDDDDDEQQVDPNQDVPTTGIEPAEINDPESAPNSPLQAMANKLSGLAHFSPPKSLDLSALKYTAPMTLYGALEEEEEGEKAAARQKDNQQDDPNAGEPNAGEPGALAKAAAQQQPKSSFDARQSFRQRMLDAAMGRPFPVAAKGTSKQQIDAHQPVPTFGYAGIRIPPSATSHETKEQVVEEKVAWDSPELPASASITAASLAQLPVVALETAKKKEEEEPELYDGIIDEDIIDDPVNQILFTLPMY